MSNPFTKNEEEFSQMILDIVAKKPEAKRRFFNNLSKISDNSEDNEKLRLDIIDFITIWCDFGDIVIVKALVNNFCNILSQHPSKNVLLSFLTLLREVITKCGNSILPELLSFSKIYKEICEAKFIRKKVFPFISAFIDSDGNDVSSCCFSFLVSLIPEIGEESIQKLISISHIISKSKNTNSRLAAVHSFPILLQYATEDKDKYFDDIILESLHDACYLVQTHSVRIAAAHVDLIKDISPLLAISNDPSWKVKYSLIENIGVFIKSFKEFENVLFYFARSKDIMVSLRESAFYQMGVHFDIISNTNEIYCCVDVALRQKEDNLIIAGLLLIPKIYNKNKDLVQQFQSLLTRFRSIKKESVQFCLIKCALPYVSTSQNEKDMAKRWLLAGFDSDDWSVNDAALESTDCLLNCENKLENFITDDIFEKVVKMLTHMAFNVRNRAAIVCISFVKNRGWDFAKEKLMPVIRSIVDNCSITILQTIVRVYIGLKVIGPPRELKKEINSVITKAKNKKELVYIVPMKESKNK